MKRKEIIAAVCFIVAELIIQLVGIVPNITIPDFFWKLADGILIMAPLLFGLKRGILCLLPMVATENIWFIRLSVPGPLLHAAAFAVIVCLFGVFGERLARSDLKKRAVLTAVLFEAGLLAEEILYHFLRSMVIGEEMDWSSVTGSFLSWANPVLLLIGIIWIVAGYRAGGAKDSFAN